MPLRFTWLDTPLGAALLTADGDALTRITLGATPADVAPSWERAGAGPGVLAEACAQLGEYLAGGRTAFTLPLAPAGTDFQRRVWDALAGARTTFDLPLAPRGTPFQQRVWAELRRIPHGATISYGELARRVGEPRASRAVGAANGRNPIAIVVPCHRVVGADGSLTGYAGGLDRKRWLLHHEAAVRGRTAGGFALALG